MKLTGGIIWILETIYGRHLLVPKLEHLRALPTGTVGREVADLLDSKHYRLIPKFENHDLKHVILDYEMTMPDEIRMQAYLLGNGNRTITCLAFFALGIGYPKIWKDLPAALRAGKRCNSIHLLTLEDCMASALEEIKAKYGRKYC